MLASCNSRASTRVSVGLLFSLSASSMASLFVSPVAQASSYDMLTDYAVERVNHARENAPIPVDGAFGDQTSLYNGTVTFSNADISVPGNSQLPVELRRAFAVEDRRETNGLGATGKFGGFGDWDLDIPNLHGTFAQTTGWQTSSGSDPNARCSNPGLPAFTSGSFNVYDIWDTYAMHVPGAGDQQLLINDVAGTPQPTNATTHPWITKDFWVLSCKATTANGYPGQGFIATSPQGVRYTFDWVVSKGTSSLAKKGNPATGTGPLTVVPLPRVTV